MSTTRSSSSDIIEDDSSQYQYASLPDEKKCIRLIELFPGSNRDHIRCRFHTEKSRPFRAYKAISYCWGDSYDTVDIQCDGKILGVPRNLRDALEHFRLPDQSRTLWADAICINQSNKKEQGHQVMQMGRIFKEAECVLIWLGRGTGSKTQRMFDLITYLESMISSLTEPMRRVREKNLAHTIRRLPVEFWKELDEMLRYAWFERIWVLQEVGLAAKAMLFCGRAVINWKTFAETCSWLCYQHRVFAQNSLPLNQARLNSVRGMYTMGFKNQNFKFPGSIYQVLVRTSRYKSTDPRDKIYALLGHPAFADLIRKLSLESFVPIEYSHSPFDTFLNAATVLMQLPTPLRVFHFVHHEHDVEENVEGFISWVPQWAWRDNPINLLDRPDGLPDFIRHSTPRFKIWGRQLHISGGMLDPVSYVSDKFDRNPFNPRSKGRARDQIIQTWNDLKDIMAGHNEENVFQDLCDSITAGGEKRYTDYEISLNGLPNLDSVKAEFLADFFLYLNVAGVKFSNREALERLHTGNGDLWRLWSYARVLKQRCVFVTAGGHLGIGNGIMKTGDLVCFFYGAHGPCIIRRAPKKLGFWFIGQCYISGVEKMAAMKQAELGNLKEDTFILY